ncbi:hypothetical protein CDL15_Pgr001205 [Punica granatum]|uniref:Uncharacterized protein n=1 Tax=Punica granatum TaxID=22663 RepID=A0A218WLF9_PUNGR|nr:hypothetical protein CDL15_Pgr001205 [Punica granatum]
MKCVQIVTEANMLNLESPARVGFSYSANTTFYELVNDKITDWESCSGVQHRLQFRAEYLWSHGLIADSTNEKYTFVCSFSTNLRQAARSTLTPVRQSVICLVGREIGNFIDTYDNFLNVCLSSATSQSIKLNQLQETKEIDVCVEDQVREQEAFHARVVSVTIMIRHSMNSLDIQTSPT